MNPRVLLSWSSGKDSAWALHVLRQRGDVDVVGLVTTVNERHDRVAMHAVRVELLERQAVAARLPLWKVPIPDAATNEQYETAMRALVERARGEGIEHFAFGDLFLEDVRGYRERQLAETGIRPLFPLWRMPTPILAEEMIGAGLEAVLTCVDPKALPGSMVGRSFDARLLAELPAEVDPCGEKGEFHTFAHAGPMFERPIAIEIGAALERDGFVFVDVRPRPTPSGGPPGACDS
jgi:uncharacterized protein (TIGR00290 family)